MVTQEDNQIKEFLHQVDQKVHDKENEVKEIILGIEDTKHTWDEAVERINQALMSAMEEHGLTKEEFDLKFDELIKCENCRNDIICPDHKIL